MSEPTVEGSHYVRTKPYDKAIKEAIARINDGVSPPIFRRLASRFTLLSIDCILPSYHVADVLECICNQLLPNNVSMIIFLTASEEYDDSSAGEQYFLTVASYTGIPILAWNADNSAFTFGDDLSPFRILQLAPPINHQIRAMMALMLRYNWTRFGVVVTNMPGAKEFVYQLIEELEENTDKQVKLEMIYSCEIDTSNVTDINGKLLELKKSQSKIILLYSNVQQSKLVFEQAQKLGMTNERYLWIGTQSVKGSDTAVRDPLQAGMLSINFHTLSHATFAPPDDVILLMIHLAPRIFATALASTNETFNAKPSISCRTGRGFWDEGEIIYRKLKEVEVKGNSWHPKDGHDSFFYTFDDKGRLKNSMLQVSNLRRNPKGGYMWKPVGVFTDNELRMEDVEWPGNKANPPLPTADKFHIKVVTLHEPPFITVSEIDPDTKECPGNQGSICDWGDESYKDGDGNVRNRTLFKCCSGYCVDLLNKLANDIGFTFSLYKVRDEKWGLKTEQGWNGLVADLMNGKADMCVTSLKLNSERARDIDFSLPFLDTGIAVIVKIRSGVLSPTAFLEPFEYSTWVIIMLICIQGAALSIFIFEWASPYSFNMQRYPPPGHKFSLCRSYWLVWATLFSASVSTDVPKSTVSRFMALVWAAFGLTFLAVYTANLAAFMITRVQFYDIADIHDPLLMHPEDHNPPFRFGTVDGVRNDNDTPGYVMITTRGNTHETMKRNWHSMLQYVTENQFFRANISAGVEAVKNEELDAFIYDAVVLDYWAGKDANCELMMVGKWASMTGYGFGFPKNSPYTALVNKYILEYQHKGDLERLQNFWLTGACSPDSQSQTHSTPLGIENFFSAFFLLAGGIYVYVHKVRQLIRKVDPTGWCGIISMSMAKSLTLPEAVNRVQEWRSRTQSLASASNNSPLLMMRKRRSISGPRPEKAATPSVKYRNIRFIDVESKL